MHVMSESTLYMAPNPCMRCLPSFFERRTRTGCADEEQSCLCSRPLPPPALSFWLPPAHLLYICEIPFAILSVSFITPSGNERECTSTHHAHATNRSTDRPTSQPNNHRQDTRNRSYHFHGTVYARVCSVCYRPHYTPSSASMLILLSWRRFFLSPVSFHFGSFFVKQRRWNWMTAQAKSAKISNVKLKRTHFAALSL